jgi:hypothetical protein
VPGPASQTADDRRGGSSPYLAGRRSDYPDSNVLFNGDFERPPSGAAPDWRNTAAPGAVTAREDEREAAGGRCIFRSRDWRTSVTGTRRRRCACARANTCSRRYARTKDLTTNEGIRFHLFDKDSSARLDVHTEQLRGTNNWTRVETRCRVRAGTRLIQVGVCRVPSWKFDNKIKAEAWLDDVSLKAVP